MVMFVEHVFFFLLHLHIASVLKIPIDAPKKKNKNSTTGRYYDDDVEELYYCSCCSGQYFPFYVGSF